MNDSDATYVVGYVTIEMPSNIRVSARVAIQCEPMNQEDRSSLEVNIDELSYHKGSELFGLKRRYVKGKHG